MFFNPSSGVKIAPSELSALEQSASDAGFEVVHVTRDIDCLSLIRDRLREGRRLFVAAGGDGTINTVIQPLIHTEAILGVIPVGTYNHFAKDLGIPLASRDALEVIISGHTDGTFGPTEDVSRAQMAKFINNGEKFLTGTAYSTTNDYFTDDDGNTHEANINAIASAGIASAARWTSTSSVNGP